MDARGDNYFRCAPVDQFPALSIQKADLVIKWRAQQKIPEQALNVFIIEFGFRVQPKSSGNVIIFKQRQADDGFQIDSAIVKYIFDLIRRPLNLDHLLMAHQPIDPLFRRLNGKEPEDSDGQTHQRKDKYQQFRENGKSECHMSRKRHRSWQPVTRGVQFRMC